MASARLRLGSNVFSKKRLSGNYDASSRNRQPQPVPCMRPEA